MTEPGGVEVGHAYVSVIPSARGFAKTLRSALEREIRASGLDEMVSNAFSGKTIHIPVKPDVGHIPDVDVPVHVDSTGFGEKVRLVADEAERRTKVKLKVDVDKDGKLGSLVPDNLAGKVQQITSALQGAAGSAVTFGGQVAGAFQAVFGPVSAIVGAAFAAASAIGSVAGAAIIGVPALSALAGAAAAIPGALSGAGAALATLGLGFKGIAEAFKPKTGGGGGAGSDPAAQARQIAQATRGVESAQRSLVRAQRDVIDSQRAVNKAITDEIERRSDLQRALKSAQLDQRDAALGVTEALRHLNEVKATGVLPDIQRAQLEYEQAQQRVLDVADAQDDLRKQQTEAAKTGVRGSEQVQAALKRQQDASDGLKSATDGLTSAQEALNAARNPPKTGGSSAALANVIKLAPNAQKFVDAIKALKPAFEALRLDVQNRLFANLDRTITHLAEAWLPQLHVTLGRYADTFNGFFRSLGANLGKPKFIQDIAAGAEGARAGLEAIGRAISGPLVAAFGALSRASAPFLKALGDDIAQVVTQFSRWITAGERSGALQTFFANATKSMKDIFDIGGTVASIIGSLISIITGKQLGTGKTPLEQFRDGLQKVSDWLKDPQNQQKVRDFFGQISDSLLQVNAAVAHIAGWIQDFRNLRHAMFGGSEDGQSAGQIIGEALITGIVTGVKTALQAALSLISALLWRGPDSLIGRIKSGLGIASPSRLTTAMGVELINGLIRGIGDRFGALADRVRQIPGRIVNAVGNTARILYSSGINAIIGLANGVLSQYDNLTRWVGSIRGAISNALANAGSLLYNAGRNVVYGLWNGIASLGSWLAGRVAAFVTAYVPGPIRNALGIFSPSRVAAELGARVPEGLALGIASGQGAVVAAAAGLADAAVPSISPAVVGSVGANLGTGATSAGRLTIEFVGTDSRILDGLRSAIKVTYNGDPAAALASR